MKQVKRILFLLVLIVILVGILNRVNISNIPYIQPVKLEVVVKDVISSVVHIKHSNGRQGSGVLVSKDGIILTARHVIKDGGKYTITMNDGIEYTSTKAVTSKKHDVGFIKMDINEDLPFSYIGNSDDLQRGQQIFMIGSPFGKTYFNSVTSGVVSGKRKFDLIGMGWYSLVQTDTVGNPGNSGCPIFDMSGKIVGIVVGSPTRYYCGIVLCIQSDTFKQMLDQAKFMFLMSDLKFVDYSHKINPGSYSPYSSGRMKDPMGHILNRTKKACGKCHE